VDGCWLATSKLRSTDIIETSCRPQNTGVVGGSDHSYLTDSIALHWRRGGGGRRRGDGRQGGVLRQLATEQQLLFVW